MFPSVLVIGAGPVGLVAAAELARHGVAVRIIDKLTQPTDESRAIAIHARSLDMLDRMGVADELIATGVKARGMQLYSGSHRLVRIPLDCVQAAHPYSLNTAQTETERVLGRHLEALGVTVDRGVEVTDLFQNDDCVRVMLQHHDGTTEDITVDWVIGADGAHSIVRRLVGDKLAGSFAGERFMLGDVYAEHNLDPESMYTFFAPEGPVLVMPMCDNRVRIMPQVASDTPLDHKPTLVEMQQILDERVGGITLTGAHWLTTFELHHALVSHYRHGRVFLTGDAAHIHSPAGGQGMNTGMQDAFNLAWKLAAVVNGEAGDTLLDSYEAERRPVAESVITYADRLSKAGTLRGAPQHLRNALLKVISHIGPLPRAMATATAEVNVGYADSSITKGDAGQHFPFLGNNDVQKQIDDTWDTGHTVLTVTAGREVLAGDAVIDDPQRLIAEHLGLRHGGRIVVRPDGYIGAIAALDDPATITAYFDNISR